MIAAINDKLIVDGDGACAFSPDSNLFGSARHHQTTVRITHLVGITSKLSNIISDPLQPKPLITKTKIRRPVSSEFLASHEPKTSDPTNRKSQKSNTLAETSIPTYNSQQPRQPAGPFQPTH